MEGQAACGFKRVGLFYHSKAAPGWRPCRQRGITNRVSAGTTCSSQQGYDKWLADGQSKTANALFAVHLDRLGQRDGVRAFSLHPGKIFTPLQRHLTQHEMIAAGWLDPNGNPADPTFKTTQQGAATQVWAATSPQLNGNGGLYCEDCQIAPLDESEPPSFVGVRPYAVDPEQAERLWALSAQLTGIDAFSTK